MFYDKYGNELSWGKFLNYYEPCYFLSSKPDLPVKIINKTSPFIENKIENILKYGLHKEDITLIIAWKLGCINHVESESLKQIIYESNFNENHITRYHDDFSGMLEYLNNNFTRLSNLAQDSQNKELFRDLCKNSVSGFGTTYIINLSFFFTGGNLPIYDDYVNQALYAIKNKCKPNNIQLKKVKQIPALLNRHQDHVNKAWSFYQSYVNDLRTISGSDYITRTMDRAFWVYGHCFKKQGKSGGCR